MATFNVALNGKEYTLVTDAAHFIAENTSNGKMLGIFSSTPPSPNDDARVIHPSEQVVRSFNEPEGRFYAKMAHPEGRANITVDAIFEESLGEQNETDLNIRSLRATEDLARTVCLIYQELVLLNERFEEAFNTEIDGGDL